MERDEEVAALRAENARLRDRIEQLEELNGMTIVAPICLGLTGQEARLIAFLMRRGQVTKEQVLIALYEARPEGDIPLLKIVDVFVCKVRRKLRPFGVSIRTFWGQGYGLDEADKARLLALGWGRA